MKITRCSLANYLKAVNQKMEDPEVSRLMQFGTVKPVAGQTRLRDATGIECTKATVLQSANNLYTVTAGRDAFAKKMTNFSARMDAPSTGFEAVSDVKTIGSIDVTIVALSTSIIPFVAVDRGMSMPTDTVWYNDLIALNSAGGVVAGEAVTANFTPPNSKVNLGPWDKAEAAAATLTVAAGTKHIIPGTVKVVATVGGVNFEGKDYAGDGAIVFPYGAGLSAAATVDYDTGAISVATSAATNIVATWKNDVAADGDGKNVLQVAPDWKAVTLETEADNIVMKDNLVNRAYMNKAQLLATAGAKGMSSADILFARTKDAYVEYLNRKVLKELLDGVTTDAIELDLSTYSVSNFAQTKNDMLLQFITNAQATFLGTTGIGCTSIVTGTYGVALLSAVPGVWTPNPELNAGLNGLAGYFNGIAVYRHNYMDYIVTTAGNSYFLFSAKLPDNNSGSCVYGEFLPITHTGVVSNFDMPQNISAGLFSMTGAKKVAGNLVLRANVKIPAPQSGVGLFGTGKIG